MPEAEAQHSRSPQGQSAGAATTEQATPMARPTNPLLAMQQTVGNQAVQRQLRAGTLPPWLILGQEQTLGNRAVQRQLGADRLSLGSRVAALQRQPVGAALRVNDRAALAQATAEELFQLYMTDEETHTNERIMATYTRAWVRGEGQEPLRAAIRAKLEIRRQEGDEGRQTLEWYSRHIGLLEGDEARRRWLLEAVQFRLRNVEGDTASDGGPREPRQTPGSADTARDVSRMSYAEKLGLALAVAFEPFIEVINLALVVLLLIIVLTSVAMAYLEPIMPVLWALFPGVMEVVTGLLAAAGLSFAVYFGARALAGASRAITDLDRSVRAARTTEELEAAGRTFGRQMGNAVFDLALSLIAVARALRPALQGIGPMQRGGGRAPGGGRAAPEGQTAPGRPAAAGEPAARGETRATAPEPRGARPRGERATPDQRASAEARAEQEARGRPTFQPSPSRQAMIRDLMDEHPGLHQRVADESVEGAVRVMGRGGGGGDVDLGGGVRREVTVHTGRFDAQAIAGHLETKASQEGVREIYMQINSASAARPTLREMMGQIQNGYQALSGIRLRVYGPNGQLWWQGNLRFRDTNPAPSR